MELRYYYRVIAKRFWLIVLVCAVGAGTSLYYSLSQPPLYKTSTTLLLSPASSSDRLIPSPSESLQEFASTYIHYMKTKVFAKLVIEKTGLDINPGELASSTSARIIPGTQFLEISANSSSPQKAQLLANTMAETFMAESLAQQTAHQAARQEAAGVKDVEFLKGHLERECQYYERRVASLRRRIEELETEPPSNERDEKLLNLDDQLIEAESLLVQVMTNLTELQPKQQLDSLTTAVIVEPAPLPTKPMGTKTLQTVLFALATSLALGIGLAFLLEYLDYTIKTPEELDKAYGMSTLGVVGIIGRETEAKTEAEKVVVLHHPKSSIAEAFRALRTNIQFANPGKSIRSLLVTSAGPLKGKTITAANSAVAIAQAGKRVILVDTDLRKPGLHKVFGLSNRTGFTNLFIEDPDRLTDYLQETEVDGLWILTSGPLPPNPSELLGSPRAEEIMGELAAVADMVIYDSPPAAPVTDAVILASRVDATLQVVLAGVTRRDLVVKGKEVLTKVGAKVLGPVLNKVKQQDLGYYYYYYHPYYHKTTSRLKEPVPIAPSSDKAAEEKAD